MEEKQNMVRCWVVNVGKRRSGGSVQPWYTGDDIGSRTIEQADYPSPLAGGAPRPAVTVWPQGVRHTVVNCNKLRESSSEKHSFVVAAST